MPVKSAERITKTPGVCGGRACIAGHRVRVLDIVALHEHAGLNADEIVSRLPTITLSDVHAALAYYFDHVEEVRQEIREEREASEDIAAGLSSQVQSRVKKRGLEQAS